jgi:hypothetical protein
MDAIYAGLTAWSIELMVVGIMLYALHIEENKVHKRRSGGRR